jgi:hypothetical protein
VRDGELAHGRRRARVGGLGRLAEPAVGPGLRDGAAVVRGGAARDRDRVLPAAAAVSCWRNRALSP